MMIENTSMGLVGGDVSSSREGDVPVSLVGNIPTPIGGNVPTPIGGNVPTPPSPHILPPALSPLLCICLFLIGVAGVVLKIKFEVDVSTGYTSNLDAKWNLKYLSITLGVAEVAIDVLITYKLYLAMYAGSTKELVKGILVLLVVGILQLSLIAYSVLTIISVFANVAADYSTAKIERSNVVRTQTKLLEALNSEIENTKGVLNPIEVTAVDEKDVVRAQQRAGKAVGKTGNCDRILASKFAHRSTPAPQSMRKEWLNELRACKSAAAAGVREARAGVEKANGLVAQREQELETVAEQSRLSRSRMDTILALAKLGDKALNGKQQLFPFVFYFTKDYETARGIQNVIGIVIAITFVLVIKVLLMDTTAKVFNLLQGVIDRVRGVKEGVEERIKRIRNMKGGLLKKEVVAPCVEGDTNQRDTRRDTNPTNSNGVFPSVQGDTNHTDSKVVFPYQGDTRGDTNPINSKVVFPYQGDTRGDTRGDTKGNTNLVSPHTKGNTRGDTKGDTNHTDSKVVSPTTEGDTNPTSSKGVSPTTRNSVINQELTSNLVSQDTNHTNSKVVSPTTKQGDTRGDTRGDTNLVSPYQGDTKQGNTRGDTRGDTRFVSPCSEGNTKGDTKGDTNLVSPYQGDTKQGNTNPTNSNVVSPYQGNTNPTNSNVVSPYTNILVSPESGDTNQHNPLPPHTSIIINDLTPISLTGKPSLESETTTPIYTNKPASDPITSLSTLLAKHRLSKAESLQVQALILQNELAKCQADATYKPTFRTLKVIYGRGQKILLPVLNELNNILQ